MHHKITRKLVLYFTAVLLLFATIVGLLFVVLLSKHTMSINRTELLDQVEQMAELLGEELQNSQLVEEEQQNLDIYGEIDSLTEKVVSEGSNSYDREHYTAVTVDAHRGAHEDSHRETAAYQNYIQMMEKLNPGKIWVVDKDAHTISVGHGDHAVSYQDLPKDAEELIQEVFQGNQADSESFSGFLQEQTITVGAPVLGADQEVLAAVLLHADVRGMEQGIAEGVKLLAIAAAAALVLGILVSCALAARFISPLHKMEQATQKMVAGDYAVHTEVNQKDEIGDLAKSMDVLAERLMEASLESRKLEQMRQDFISKVSHELRTPVTVIRGSLEALCDGVVTEPLQVQEYHEQMLRDSIHLQRLVNDLLELNRLRNLDFRVEMEPMNLLDAFTDAIRSARRMAAERNLEMITNNQVLSFPIAGDYGRLKQMFLIVLDNAIKFSNEGGVVELLADFSEAGCEIQIRDYGDGIEEEDMPHIFDKFYQEHSQKNSTGTGLGLAIAKQIAIRHNIKLLCWSQKGEGTTFLFQVPSKE